MRRSIEVSSVLFLAVALGAGCNNSSGDTSVDLGGTPDAGMTGTDAGPGTDAGGMCGTNVVPSDGFGARVGSHFAPLTLSDCNGASHDFYDATYCTSQITVVTIAAGWCHPCNLEADQLESMLIMPYAPRGVRVIQVLSQDDNYHAPTPAFCQTWLDRTNGWPSSPGYYTPPDTRANHVLSATDHLTLLDPMGLTQIYNPASSIPATIIVDGDGVIQDRFNGTSTDPTSGMAALTDITACLDKLLSTPSQNCF